MWTKSLLLWPDCVSSCAGIILEESLNPGDQVLFPTCTVLYFSYEKQTLPWGREPGRYTPWHTLWVYLCDHGEDMGNWDRKPTSVLATLVCELQGNSPPKNVAPVPNGKLHQKSRIMDAASDPPEETPKVSLHNATDYSQNYGVPASN